MRVGVLEAKNRLSVLLETAQRGEEVVFTKRGEPVAILNVVRKRIGLDAVLAGLADLGRLDIRPETAPTPEQLQTIAKLAVSHRLSAVVDAAQIAVLRAGRITEQGTHAELVALGGWYAVQWRYQQLEAQIEAL